MHHLLPVVGTLVAVCALITGAASQVLKAAVQSSTNANSTANLAMDNNPSTCSVTGYGTGNWWKAEFDSQITIAGVVVTGSSGVVEIRFGLQSDSYGIRSGFQDNVGCVVVNPGLGVTSSTYTCRYPVTGRYLSIKAVDPNAVNQLSICSLDVILA